jgi:hypothetical protein
MERGVPRAWLRLRVEEIALPVDLMVVDPGARPRQPEHDVVLATGATLRPDIRARLVVLLGTERTLAAGLPAGRLSR